MEWFVPSSGLEDGFFSSFWGHGQRWFSTQDVNGDGILDLIQTADPERANGFVWRDVTGPFWKVWLGTREGFQREHTRWAVPESGLEDGFFTTTWQQGQRWFGFRDLNGDNYPDIIQTADSERDGGYIWGNSASAYWKVWLGGAHGFDRSRITRPDSGCPTAYTSLAHGN